MGKMKKYVLSSLIILQIGLISCQESNNIIPEDKMISLIQRVNDTGFVIAEMSFEYNDDLLERTIYKDHLNSNSPISTTPYTLVDSFFYSNDRQLIMTSNTEERTQICGLDSKFIYENNELIRIQKESSYSDSEPEITFIKNEINEIKGYYIKTGIGIEGYEAVVTLDKNNNIIDVVEPNSNQFLSSMLGARGTNEYDDMKNPFKYFDEEIRIYWSFGLPCQVFDEMKYGLGENNRLINKNSDPAGLSSTISVFHYEYTEFELPQELIITQYYILNKDTLSINTEQFLYFYK